MSQTIQNFFSQAVARDFSRDFLFRVQNLNFGPGGAVLNDDELVYAKTATLPERAITNTEVKYRGLGFQLPGSVTYGNAAAYQIEFYCDANARIREILLNESRRVFNDQTTTGNYRIGGPGASLTLQQLDKSLAPIMEFKLIGCSIRSVGAVNYSMADGNGAVVNFPCTIAYHYFTEDRLSNAAL